MRSRLVVLTAVGVIGAGAVSTVAGIAYADGDEPVFDMSGVDGAICDTQEVVVRDTDAVVRAGPDTEADELFTADKGEFFACSAVEVGEKHSACGASESDVWMILTDAARFDVYVPSHCVADVYR